MKRQILMLIASAMTFAATTAFAQSGPTPSHSPPAQHPQLYTCPMHPEIVRSEPGQCPKCGMTMVPIKETNPKAEHSLPNPEHATHLMPGEHATHNPYAMAIP